MPQAIILETSHGTVVAVDRETGQLQHLRPAEAVSSAIVDVREGLELTTWEPSQLDGQSFNSGPLAGYVIYVAKDRPGFLLCKNGLFLCAEQDSNVLVCDRLTPGSWECFTLTNPEPPDDGPLHPVAAQDASDLAKGDRSSLNGFNERIMSAADFCKMPGESDAAKTLTFAPRGAPTMQLYTVRDALIIGAPGIWGVERGRQLVVFGESVSYPGMMPSFAQERLEAADPLPERVEHIASACLLDRVWANNFWHWFTEAAPTAVVLEEAGFDGTYLVPAGNPVWAETLKCLGIPAARIREHSMQHLRVGALHFTETFSGHDLWRWPWLLERLRQRALPTGPATTSPRRLYIGRRGIKRAVANEAEVIALLRKFDFAIYYMEDLSIREQMSLACGAEIVLGPHGAGLVYSMFMRHGGHLIELFHARYVNPCMTAICDTLEIDYRMLVSHVNPPDNFARDDLIMVALPSLSATLKSVIRLGRADKLRDSVNPEIPAAVKLPQPEQKKEVPRSMSSHDHFTSVLRRYQGDRTFNGVDIDKIVIDTHGFQSPDNERFFADIFHTFQPITLVEMGSWKGSSAIMFAKHMRAYCENPALACIDTWLGSVEHWVNPEWKEQLGLRNGFPTLFERFAANVIRAGVAGYITPLPMTTRTGINLLQMAGVRADLIYVDASHEYNEVLEDLHGAWSLVADEGLLIADDYNAPDVRKAIQEFRRQSGANGMYNADSGWPEALLTKTAAARDKAMACHVTLVEISD